LYLASNSGFAQTPHSPALRQADALIRQGKPEQAWQLLAPLEIQQAGEPNFDYLLGIAALESGRPNRATFILERVIAGNPGHLAARLEMARAYFALGDYERAERELDLILKSSPTPQTTAVTRSYLARLPERSPLANDRLSGYLEFTLGRDTNVTAASAQTGVPLPALGTEFLPDSLSLRRPDDFAALGASLEYNHFLRSGVALIGGVDFRQRWNSNMDAYDTRIIDLQVALRHELRGGDRMQYSVRHNDSNSITAVIAKPRGWRRNGLELGVAAHA
jgi:tetratricopeptide (TPR) repeat protein